MKNTIPLVPVSMICVSLAISPIAQIVHPLGKLEDINPPGFSFDPGIYTNILVGTNQLFFTATNYFLPFVKTNGMYMDAPGWSAHTIEPAHVAMWADGKPLVDVEGTGSATNSCVVTKGTNRWEQVDIVRTITITIYSRGQAVETLVREVVVSSETNHWVFQSGWVKE